MPSPIVLLAFVLVLAISNAFTWAKATNVADTRWTAKIQTERAAFESSARESEHRHQEAANEIATKHQAAVAAVRRNLDIALDSLRNRTERPAVVPETARTCESGGTGADLFRTDAEFLVREAARADNIRAGLDACYQHVDSLK